MSEERREFIGRVITRRWYGRRGFAILQSRGGRRQQVYMDKRTCGEEAYQTYLDSAVNTIVRVEGETFRTRQLNILTIRSEVWEVVEAAKDIPACFTGRLTDRRRLGKAQYAYLEAVDGKRQQILIRWDHMSPEGFEAFRKCELGTQLIVDGTMFVTNLEGIQTILVTDLTIMGGYQEESQRYQLVREEDYDNP